MSEQENPYPYGTNMWRTWRKGSSGGVRGFVGMHCCRQHTTRDERGYVVGPRCPGIGPDREHRDEIAEALGLESATFTTTTLTASEQKGRIAIYS